MFSEPQRNIEQFQVDPGMRVADLGAGTGAYTLPLARAVGDSGTVYAVEVQQDLLSKLKKEGEQSGFKNIKAIWGDFENIGGTTLPDTNVERAIFSNVLFQAADKRGALQEAHRILKPNGKLLIVDWSESFGGLGPQPDHIFSEAEARHMAEEQGFTFDRNIQAGTHHYGLIFKKQ